MTWRVRPDGTYWGTRAKTHAADAAASLKTAQAGQDPTVVADAQSTHDTAQKALDEAASRLAALATAAREAHDDLRAAAKECAKALRHAQSDGIHNKHWWEHVGEALSDLGGEISKWAGEIGQIAQVLAPVLNGIALLTAEIPGVDVVTASLAVADDLIAETAPEVAAAGSAMEATGDAMQGHWADAFSAGATFAMSRAGNKAKGGGTTTSEEATAPGTMAAQEGRTGPKSVGRTDRTDSGFDYEQHLQDHFGGSGEFKVGQRTFDGKYATDDGEVWYEAKSGNFWNDEARINKFKSQAGQQRQIAHDNGADFHVYSERDMPEHVTKWLDRKEIPYQIIPRPSE